MQSCTLESGKIRFNQVKPRRICRRPINPDTPTDFCREFTKSFLMGSEIIHNQMNTSTEPRGQKVLQPESPTGIGGFDRKSLSNSDAGVGTKGTKPLQNSITSVTIGTKWGLLAPRFSSPGDGLQWPHFVKTDYLPPSGAMAIDLNYSVFFTSKSGSFFRTRFVRLEIEDRDATGCDGWFRDR